jgi:hypothetical protein
MEELLKILEVFSRRVLRGKSRLDQDFLEDLIQQGVSEVQLENALFVIYNIVANRGIPSDSSISEKSFRHFLPEEASHLGDRLVWHLSRLQLCGLLSPAELDFLVFGFLQSGMPFDSEEDFWSLLKLYRSDIYDYLSCQGFVEDNPALLH